MYHWAQRRLTPHRFLSRGSKRFGQSSGVPDSWRVHRRINNRLLPPFGQVACKLRCDSFVDQAHEGCNWYGASRRLLRLPCSLFPPPPPAGRANYWNQCASKQSRRPLFPPLDGLSEPNHAPKLHKENPTGPLSAEPDARRQKPTRPNHFGFPPSPHLRTFHRQLNPPSPSHPHPIHCTLSHPSFSCCPWPCCISSSGRKCVEVQCPAEQSSRCTFTIIAFTANLHLRLYIILGGCS